MLARFAIVASACLAVALGGCSLDPLEHREHQRLHRDQGDGRHQDQSARERRELQRRPRHLRERPRHLGRATTLNKVGSCQTIIKNQIKTIDDNTHHDREDPLAGKTATATVQSTFNGKKVDSSMTLDKQSGGWRIAAISAL